MVSGGSVGWIFAGRKLSFTRQVMRELLPVPVWWMGEFWSSRGGGWRARGTPNLHLRKQQCVRCRSWRRRWWVGRPAERCRELELTPEMRWMVELRAPSCWWGAEPHDAQRRMLPANPITSPSAAGARDQLLPVWPLVADDTIVKTQCGTFAICFMLTRLRWHMFGIVPQVLNQRCNEHHPGPIRPHHKRLHRAAAQRKSGSQQVPAHSIPCVPPSESL